MVIVLKSFILAFSALLPVINPLGSALIFLSLVGTAPADLFRNLARQVGISTVLFLVVIELAGAFLLSFFGISLPVVQLAGGLVLASMGWALLNEKDKNGHTRADPSAHVNENGSLEEKVFYPLTFPVTAGPGCIVVTLTLSAHAWRPELLSNFWSHLGITLGIAAQGLAVWLSYAYAPKITQRISPQTVHGILRVIAFVLLCIGVQIAWNGLETMIKAMPK
jgi:multiple antibiotic resistance protein